MKQILAILVCCAVLVLAGCGQEVTPTQQPTTTQAETTEVTVPTTAASEPTEPLSTAVYSDPLSCVSIAPITETEKQDDSTLFYYTYPTVSVQLPDADVAEVVKLDLLNKIDSTAQTAQTIKATAQKDYPGSTAWYHYYMEVFYIVQRLDSNVLSVSGVESTFDGTPNSTSIAVSANYDLSTGARLDLRSILFADYSADVLVELIIEGLADYDEATLLPGYKDVIDQMFSTNVPVESWYFDSNGLCFYFAPYEIAPHAMGIIYSHIPYSSLGGLMTEAYFPLADFTYTGEVKLDRLADSGSSTLESYSQFGEVTIDDGGVKYLLRSEGSIQDLRIYELQQDNGPGQMLFAGAGMGPDIAVLLDLPADTNGLYISFVSNGETVTAPITDLP